MCFYEIILSWSFVFPICCFILMLIELYNHRTSKISKCIDDYVELYYIRKLNPIEHFSFKTYLKCNSFQTRKSYKEYLNNLSKAFALAKNEKIIHFNTYMCMIVIPICIHSCMLLYPFHSGMNDWLYAFDIVTITIPISIFLILIYLFFLLVLISKYLSMPCGTNTNKEKFTMWYIKINNFITRLRITYIVMVMLLLFIIK